MFLVARYTVLMIGTNNKQPIILASKSPRRTALLSMAGIAHEVIPATHDEVNPLDPNEVVTNDKAVAAVKQLGFAKAQEIAALHPERIVLGADTIVVCDGVCYGKPRDNKDAVRMLNVLSGKTHQVYTGVCLMRGDRVITDAVATDVTFYDPSPEMNYLIESYVASGVPLDKAGAYGIQDYGSLLIKEISGDYYNVVGLPLATVWRMLHDFSVKDD